MKKVLGLFAVCILVTSCGSVGYVSTPSSYAKAGKEVNVTKKNTNILGLTAMDAQAQSKKALEELNAKCTQGVTNVTTTVSVKGLFIFGFEKLQMSGNCK